MQVMVREPQALRRLQVLLVESDVLAQQKIRQALESVFVVQCVSSLTEAEQSLLGQPPDVLVCEVLLGCESGLDLCRSVRSSLALNHLPIMILTSLTTFQDKVAGFNAGADDYVVKPFDARHLIARIRLLSRIKRIEQRDSD